MAEEAMENCLVEEKEVKLVTLTGSRKPIKRKGWFLNPSASFTHGSAPFAPKLRRTSSHRYASKTLNSLFKGWAGPQIKWRQWVDKLRPIYMHVWKKAGIFDAIKASTYKVRKDPVSICSVLQFWCGETNTFLFPWLEATVTLEDVMILGGFSMVGECVREAVPLMGEFAEIESKMIREHRGFNQSPDRKASQSAWMNHFIEGEGDEFEHIAFLSLWLSRFVFPAPPGDIVHRNVFSIAIRLARGIRIALAPAVLASLYRDLRALRKHIIQNGKNEVFPILVWAPFQILQVWVWERFIALRPKESPHFVHYDEPRVARWDNLGMRKETTFVRLVPESPNEFQWRPYISCLDNWQKPSFYKDDGELVCGSAASDEELGSFARCLRACELVGLDCIEQYLPHRVAMQFGLDQDLPGSFPHAKKDWKLAWATYDKPEKNVKFYVPPRVFEPGLALHYYIWWKKHMVAGRNAAKRLLKKRTAESKEVFSTPKSKKLKLKDGFETTLSDWIEHRKRKFVKSHKPSSTTAKVQKKLTYTMEERIHVMLKLSATCREEVGQGVDAFGQIKRRIVEEASSSDLFDMNTEEVTKNSKSTNAGESSNSPIVAEDPERTLPAQQAQVDSEGTEESSSLRGKEPELDMQISKLKEEIVGLQEKIVVLESMVEAPEGMSSDGDEERCDSRPEYMEWDFLI